MISHQYKCIFIHISKCAGSTVENAFGVFKDAPGALAAHRGWDDKHKLYLQHATPQQLVDLELISLENWESYYKFIIYRNSWSKLLSDYMWASRMHKIDDTFENFLMKSGNFKSILTDNSKPSFCGDHLYQQKDYFFIDGNPINYNTVIDFDRIDEGFKKVVKDLNLPKNFFAVKENITAYKKSHYSFFYSLKTKKLVDKLYSEDIAYFNFRFMNQTSLPLMFNSLSKRAV